VNPQKEIEFFQKINELVAKISYSLSLKISIDRILCKEFLIPMKDKILGFILGCASSWVACLEIKRENQDLLFYLVLIVMSFNFLIGLVLLFRKSTRTDEMIS
jgi:hypothetical protein